MDSLGHQILDTMSFICTTCRSQIASEDEHGNRTTGRGILSNHTIDEVVHAEAYERPRHLLFLERDQSFLTTWNWNSDEGCRQLNGGPIRYMHFSLGSFFYYDSLLNSPSAHIKPPPTLSFTTDIEPPLEEVVVDHSVTSLPFSVDIEPSPELLTVDIKPPPEDHSINPLPQQPLSADIEPQRVDKMTEQEKEPQLFTKVNQLRPGHDGLNLTVKVINSKRIHSRSRLAECLVGDETAIIVFTARDGQVDVMKEGVTAILLNARINVFRGSMRLVVDNGGHIKVTEAATFCVKEDNNLSLIEFERIDVVM